MASVTLQGLQKVFGNTRAVDNLNLQIRDGEFVTLLGPSGCGKSTTLACIAGLEDPTEGSILFDDRRVNDLSPRDRDVAMVFQDYALYPHMSVYDNLAFGLQLRKIPKSEIERTVREVAELLGLSHLLHRRPSQLSGGQRQRVAVGRAIVRNPAVFLMDEPLSNLDAALRVSTRTEIKRLQRELGTTTIFVTHDQEEAMVLSDRIAIMNSGVLQQFAPPKDVYSDPANRFVAGFIGSPKMNFLDGHLVVSDGATYFEISNTALRWPLPGSAARSNQAEVTLGVRPEHILLSRQENGGLPGKVVLVEPVGPVTYVDLDVGGTNLKASTDPIEDFAIGESVFVRFNADRIYLFDPSSGQRIRTE